MATLVCLCIILWGLLQDSYTITVDLAKFLPDNRRVFKTLGSKRHIEQ